MPMPATWASSLGFRHVIEDALAILAGQTINPDRRAYVLRDFSNLLIEAKRGSDLVQQDTLFVTSADRSAYESYSFFDRYLGQKHDDHWTEKLKIAEAVFEELGKDVPILEERDRLAATSLLFEVLTVLRNEPNSGIPQEPEDIRIGG